MGNEIKHKKNSNSNLLPKRSLIEDEDNEIEIEQIEQ